MTIRVTRLRRQHYRATVEVFLDGKLALRLAPGVSDDIRGNGRLQQLTVKSRGFHDSPPLEVTDPKGNLLLAVVISYTKRYKLLARNEKFLQAAVMGPPIDYVPPSVT